VANVDVQEMIRYRDIGLAELRKAIAGVGIAAKSR